MAEPLIITRPEPQEIAYLEQLWIDTFGDPPELVEAFYDAFPPAQHGWIVKRGKEIVCSAYLLHGNLYLSRNAMRPAAYVYAVATPKAHRGKGYGGMLMHHFADIAAQRELLLYTRPASSSLFRWYADVMQTIPAASMCLEIIPRAPSGSELQIYRSSPEQYGEIRERYLRDVPHIALSQAFLQTQAAFSACEGGGLFSVGEGCCTCEMRSATLIIKELHIDPPLRTAAIQSMLHYFHAAKAESRSECKDGEPIVAYCSHEAFSRMDWGLLLD